MSRSAKLYVEHLTGPLEGARSNSSIDPGELTIYGFSADSRQRFGLSDSMGREEAKDAYIRHYWMVRGCNTMPHVVAWLVCDAFVNHSTRTAAIIIQKALGNVKVDGVYGTKSLKACQLVTDLHKFVVRYAEARRGYYAKRTGVLTQRYTRKADKAVEGSAERAQAEEDLQDVVAQEHGWQNRLDRLFDGLWQAGYIKPKQAPVEAVTKTAGTAVAAGAAVAVATGAAQDAGLIDIASKVAEMAIGGNLTAASAATCVAGWAYTKFIKSGRFLPKFLR